MAGNGDSMAPMGLPITTPYETTPMKQKLHTPFVPRLGMAASVAIAAAMSLSPAIAKPSDLDGDGIANIVDPDVDGDGILNGSDSNVDGGVCRKGPFKGKRVGDRLDNDDPSEKDIDGDGRKDDAKQELDIDGDGRKDDAAREKDIDGDGRDDDSARENNIDGDDFSDVSAKEDDIDGDGVSDDEDDDIDGDDSSNGDDDDCDGDGKARGKDDDDDGDGLDDGKDGDDDNDGVSDDDDHEVEASLTATADAPSGSRVRVKIQRKPSGKIELKFDARNLAEGDYDVVINGQTLGQLHMVLDGKRTEGEVDFETNPNKADELPLPFDPTGLAVEITREGVTYFTGTVPDPGTGATGGGDDDGGGTPVTGVLTAASGLSPEAEGGVEVKFGLSGVTGLEVEVEEIPAGDYDLIVDGVVRGTLTVALKKEKLRGKIRFETVPDGSGELLLDFDVAGKSIVVSQSGTTFFSGTAPASA